MKTKSKTEDKYLHVEIINGRLYVYADSTPASGETFASINDLIALLKDVKEHPEKYNEDTVVTLIGQLAGKIPIKKLEPKNPF